MSGLSFSSDILPSDCSRRAVLRGSAAVAGAMALGTWEDGMAHDGPHEFTADELTQIDGVVSGFLETSGTPGAIVGIWVPERGSLVKTYGVSDVETGVAPTERDTFRIASNTKTFVATVILQLVDEGLIGLDTPISAFDFDFPQSETATVAQLLGMTSGIFSYTEDETFAADYVANPMMPGFTPQDALALARAHDPYFAPGEGFHYSDTNLIIAGMIAEQLTGTSLPALLAERIFTPQLLHATSFPVSDPAMPDPHMRGYTPAVDDQPMLDATESNPDVGWAAGAMISSLTDLSVWVELLTTGTLLSPETQAARLQVMPIAEESPLHYGLGIMELYGFYGHNGGIAGYSSIMLYAPDDGATIVIATNLSDEHGGGADTIAMGLIELLMPARLLGNAPILASPPASPVSS
jgi:D-alanyl-D-alanine carboxypeptidase